MNTTKIKVDGKDVPIRFGSYVISLLAKEGIRLSDLKKKLDEDPVGVIANIIYFGAVNASDGKRGEGITLVEIYDWIDEQDGGFSDDEVIRVFNMFGEYLEKGVPKNQKGAEKKPKAKVKSLTPQKATE